jgi:mitochondrial fission protein ELM1
MRSTLPRFCYDLALVPQHDRLWSEHKVLRTLGALGPSIPGAPSAECGLILLGGENDHFYWSDEEVCASVAAIVAQNPRVHWQISDSPRSSKNLISAVDRALHGTDNAETVHYLDNDPQWLTQTLARAGQVWVSSDSASMLYEALSSAARVGVIELTSKRANNKLAAGIDALRREQRVGTLSAGPLDAQALKVEPLREQVRCARWILQQWFSPQD